MTDAFQRFVFAIVFLLNLFLIIAGSSGAVPFGERFPIYCLHWVASVTHRFIDTGTMLLIALLWFGISAPLSSIGAYFGSKHGVSRKTKNRIVGISNVCLNQGVSHPVKVNPIPRQIPPTPKYLRPWVSPHSPPQLTSGSILNSCCFQWAAILSGILPFGELRLGPSSMA